MTSTEQHDDLIFTSKAAWCGFGASVLLVVLLVVVFV